jgi:hypothetical protein
MSNGQWAMGNGEWAMGNGQWCTWQYSQFTIHHSPSQINTSTK